VPVGRARAVVVWTVAATAVVAVVGVVGRATVGAS
jgi:hypothetical protein